MKQQKQIKRQLLIGKQVQFLLGMVATGILLFIIYELTPFAGNIDFYVKWRECGQKPVITVEPGTFSDAKVNYYYASPTYSINRGLQKYSCSALDAEKAGYSASPNQYEFPELEKNHIEHKF